MSRREVLAFFGGSDGKESACSAGDLGSIPGLGRFLGEGNGCPLEYSCLKNPMDRGAWLAAVHMVTQSWNQRKFPVEDLYHPLGLGWFIIQQ